MFRSWLNLADKVAVGISALCVIHCLLLPALLIILPAISSVGIFGDEQFNWWLLVAVIPISFVAILLGFKHHKDWHVVRLVSTGIMILTLTALFGHDVFGEQGEVVASVIGSLLVAYGHLRNFKFRRIHTNCQAR
ncbi:MerC domain-containing protein [Alteromonas oceanisediminis]|uniref:MerC domain-containing protein n=1 Tax=Alteromonas oceanisediminis TaxID=2836180 RepID=UPI001BD9FB16|nr:MerC domain-containing protein [Alteromonas oceanisediminis]MBT0587576.1 MerC family mercury resistance protein [Alteromonas oceanisediminis]